MDNVNDRGTKKWTAMMLPEHQEMLENMWKEQEIIDKPILDEQELEKLERKLQEAFEEATLVKIKYYDGFSFSYAEGRITKLDTQKKRVNFMESDNVPNYLAFDVIMDIERM